MLDLNRSSMRRDNDARPVRDLIDTAIMKEAQKEPPRRYIGGSGIGGDCERQIQFDYMGAPIDPDWRDNPRFIRIRQRGHLMEDLAIDWLRTAGFTFKDLPDGKQIRFSDVDGEFSGGVDKIITGGPLDLQYPFLWEHKGLGQKSWKAIDSRGVRKAKPIYATQVAVYQAYLDLTAPALFQATNAESMDIHFEWIDFDQELAQKASDKAADIIADTRAGVLRPRGGNDPEKFPCMFCKRKKGCHNLPY